MTMPGGSMPSQPRVRFEAISDAWKYFQQQMGTWIAACLIYLVITLALSCGGYIAILALMGGLASGAGQPSSPEEALSALTTIMGMGFFGQFLLQLFVWILATLFTGGLYRMATRQLRGEAISLGDMMSVVDVLGALLVAAILVGLAVTIGSFLCVIPAFIVGGLLMFTVPLIVDQRLGALEAMMKSVDSLKGEWLMATLFYLVVSILGSLGALLCGIGLLFTWPLFILSVSVLYRDFFIGQAPSEASAPPPPPPSPFAPPPV